MNKNIIPIPENWRRHRLLAFIYWFFHYIFVNYIAIKHYHRIFPFHDIEKPWKLLFGMEYRKMIDEHLAKRAHHVNGKPDEKVNWVEAICDWEASGYSKPKSLLNAYETCKKYYPDKLHIVEPLLKKGKLL